MGFRVPACGGKATRAAGGFAVQRPRHGGRHRQGDRPTRFQRHAGPAGMRVEALVDQGAKVTIVAREKAALAAVEQRLGVAVIEADVTDQEAARRILADVGPEVLVLNAGMAPHQGRLDQAELGRLHRAVGDRCEGRPLLAGRAQPLDRAARPCLVGSSGAALQGSPPRAATPAPGACSGSWPGTPMGLPSRRGWATASRRSCLSR